MVRETLLHGWLLRAPRAAPAENANSAANTEGRGRSGKGSTSKLTVSMKIIPERLNFEQAPAFDAGPFLVDPLLKAGFSNPRDWPKPLGL